MTVMLSGAQTRMLNRVKDIWNHSKAGKVRCIDTPINPSGIESALYRLTDKHDFLLTISLQYPEPIVPLFTRISTTRNTGFPVLIAGKQYMYVPVGFWALHVGGMLNIIKSCRLINLSGRLGQLIEPRPTAYSDMIDKLNNNGYHMLNVPISPVAPMILVGLNPFLRCSPGKDYVADYKVAELKTYEEVLPVLTQVMLNLEYHRVRISEAILSVDPNIPHSSDAIFRSAMTSYDIIFQQIDMIMTLLARNIDITPCFRADNFIESVYKLFMTNLKEPYTYIRRPISLWLGNLPNVTEKWQSFVLHPELLLSYQAFYEQNLKNNTSKKEITRINKIVTPSISINDTLLLTGRFEVGVVGYFAGVTPIRGSITRITDGITDWTPMLRSTRNKVDQVVTPVRYEFKYVKINGVNFSSQDLSIFYNTALHEALIRLDTNTELDMPLLLPADIFLMRELVKGRCCLSYFYQNITKYCYGLLSGDNTLLAKYELKPEINNELDIGVPMREYQN